MAFSEPLVQWASESSVFLVACSLNKLERTERTSVLYRLSRKWAEEFHLKYLFFYRTGKPEPTLVPQIKNLSRTNGHRVFRTLPFTDHSSDFPTCWIDFANLILAWIALDTKGEQKDFMVNGLNPGVSDLWTDVNSHLHLTNDSYMTSNETDKQTIDGSKITAKQQPTNRCNFHVLTTNHITTKLTNQNQDQRHKYHHLATTLHLTVKMTTAQIVETSVTNISFSEDYSHPDNHAKQLTEIFHLQIMFIHFPPTVVLNMLAIFYRRLHNWPQAFDSIATPEVTALSLLEHSAAPCCWGSK